VVTTKLDLGKGKESPSLACVETAAIPIQGILSAHALTKVGTRERDSTQLTSPPEQANVNASANNVYVMLANFSPEKLTLHKATVLGLTEEVSEALTNRINIEKPQRTGSPNNPQKGARNKALYDKLLGGKLDHLNEKRLIEPVLQKYAHVFHDEETNDFKSTDVIEHKIVVTDTTPIRRPQYRTPYALRGEMECQVNDML